MLLSQWLLLCIPSWLLFLLFITVSGLFAILGLVLMRKFVSHKKLKIHNDVAGPIFSTFGVIYAVLLGFIVVITWENFDRSKQNVEREVNRLVDLQIDSAAFSQEFGAEARKLFDEYAKAVIDDEWKLLAKGESSRKVDDILKKIWLLYSRYSIRNLTEDSFFKESVHKMNELSEFRRTRIMDSRSGIQPILWFVLLMGGAITIIFTYLFGTENYGAQVIMVVLLAFLIAFILFTILSFDFPFTSDISISPEPFIKMMKLQGG